MMTVHPILIGIAVAWSVVWGIVGCVTTRHHSITKMRGWARRKTLIIRYVAILNLVLILGVLYYVTQCANYIDGR